MSTTTETPSKQDPFHAPFPTTGFCRVPEVLTILSIGRTTLWRMVQERRFPSPVRPSPFGPAVTVWRREDVAAFCRGEWKPEGGAQ